MAYFYSPSWRFWNNSAWTPKVWIIHRQYLKLFQKLHKPIPHLHSSLRLSLNTEPDSNIAKFSAHSVVHYTFFLVIFFFCRTNAITGPDPVVVSYLITLFSFDRECFCYVTMTRSFVFSFRSDPKKREHYIWLRP
jgi:hypothetical protein